MSPYLHRNYGSSIAAYKRAHDLLIDLAGISLHNRHKIESVMNDITDKIHSQSKINV